MWSNEGKGGLWARWKTDLLRRGPLLKATLSGATLGRWRAAGGKEGRREGGWVALSLRVQHHRLPGTPGLHRDMLAS